MGDRISIQFKNGEQQSVVLFSHWGGMKFREQAESYARSLAERNLKAEDRGDTPLQRLEPSTVIVDFIRHITKGMDAIEHDLYLGVDEHDGDNSDNGHFVIDLARMSRPISSYESVQVVLEIENPATNLEPARFLALNSSHCECFFRPADVCR